MSRTTVRGLLALLAMIFFSGSAHSESGSGNQSRIKTADRLSVDVSTRLPAFGGMFFEGNVLHIYLLDPAGSRQKLATQKAAVDATLAEVFGQGRMPAGGTRILKGKYTYSQLQEWQLRATPVLNVAGVTMTDNDDRKNRLTIGLESMGVRPQVEAELERLGIPLEAVSFEETGPFEPVQNLRSRVRPVLGGLQIRFQSGSFGAFCTLGFVATLPGKTDTPGFVTNSHCTAERSVVEGTAYWQPTLPDSNFIGTEILDPSFFSSDEDPSCPFLRDCRYSDSAFASLSDEGTQGGLAQTPLGELQIEGGYRIVARRLATVGETLNKVGRTTGRTEGLVLNTCISTNVAGSNITMLCQDRVAAGVGSGDSGSPVFAITDTPLANDVELAGILWGGSTGSFVYSPVANVELELGALRVCDPTDGCPGDP